MSLFNGEPRSPIKTLRIRRFPGQSISEQRQKIYEKEIEEPLVGAAGLFALGAYEALAGFNGWPRIPWFGLLVASASLVYIGWVVYRIRPRLRALRLAIDGERAVGQYLDGLRSSGYRVFHDLPGDGFNIDHVVVGPAGLFSIETKTWSLPPRGRPTIDFDGHSVCISGERPDSRPIDQARAQASWLSERLNEVTGFSYSVQPVVLFPGWFIRKVRRPTRGIWVLNPRAFPKFLGHAHQTLSDEKVSIAAIHLTQYARALK